MGGWGVTPGCRWTGMLCLGQVRVGLAGAWGIVFWYVCNLACVAVWVPQYRRTLCALLALTCGARAHCCRCEVTGLRSTETPLTQVPVFRYNTADRAVTLLRLMTVSTPLAEGKTQLEAEVRSAVHANKHDVPKLGRMEFWLGLARSPVGQQFSLINGMGEEEMGRYLALVAQRLARAEEQGGWRAKVQPSVE